MASVPSASTFSLPLPPWQQPLSVRVARYEPKKRKKDYDDWGDDDDGIEGETTDAASEIAPAPSLTLSPEEAHQYRIAGLSFDKELPGGNFPHAPAKNETSTRQSRGELMKGLSSLSNPIYPPQSAAHQGNLRLQHFAVLSSILHRCLLQRDFIRAGRAWGLIIREEFGGNPVDVRTEGRWGIGAEILLRRGRQVSDIASGDLTGDDGARKAELSKTFFTRKGFEDAKQYYETIVIQHSFQKSAPTAISPLHFYPAMFGLWIYVTQEESNVARQDLQNRHEDSPEASEDEDAASDFEGHKSSNKKQTLAAEVRTKELEEAQKIAARMDEVLMSPPYTDSSELLELRGMVSLWIADLFVSCLPYPEEEDRDLDDDDPGDLHDSIHMRREQRLASEKRQTEIQKSKDFLSKARERSRGMSSTLEDFHIDDNASLG